MRKYLPLVLAFLAGCATHNSDIRIQVNRPEVREVTLDDYMDSSPKHMQRYGGYLEELSDSLDAGQNYKAAEQVRHLVSLAELAGDMELATDLKNIYVLEHEHVGPDVDLRRVKRDKVFLPLDYFFQGIGVGANAFTSLADPKRYGFHMRNSVNSAKRNLTEWRPVVITNAHEVYTVRNLYLDFKER